MAAIQIRKIKIFPAMDSNTLDASMKGIHSVWGPLSTDVVAGCCRHLKDLVKAPATEAWLAALHREGPANQELHRDPSHGYVLLAHTEHAGLEQRLGRERLLFNARAAIERYQSL